MNILDPIGDMITRIQNAYARRKSELTVPHSKMRVRVLEVLKDEGYLSTFVEKSNQDTGYKEIHIDLKYHEGKPVIMKMKRVSKPSRRVYASVSKLPKVLNGLGISVVSTSQGIMSDVAARKLNVGGEVLFTVI